MGFDEAPDEPDHGRCSREISRLEEENDRFRAALELIRKGKVQSDQAGYRDLALMHIADEALGFPEGLEKVVNLDSQRTCK